MTLTAKQLALLAVARKRLGLVEDDWRALLLHYGGHASARELDAQGFADVMDRLRQLGFVSDARKGALGERPGMASPGQVALITRLWRKVALDGSDAALNGWLNKYHHVGALRMVSATKASAVITALKAMATRSAKPPQPRAGAV